MKQFMSIDGFKKDAAKPLQTHFLHLLYIEVSFGLPMGNNLRCLS